MKLIIADESTLGYYKVTVFPHTHLENNISLFVNVEFEYERKIWNVSNNDKMVHLQQNISNVFISN